MSAADRSVSPTLQLWEGKRNAREEMARMATLGLHVFNPEWQNLTRLDLGGMSMVGKRHSATFTNTTMKIMGSEETVNLPVQVCTRVSDVKQALATALSVDPTVIEFVEKKGCSFRKQLDCEEIGRKVTVRGIPSFKPVPNKWPHPTAVIGAGYNGLKTLMHYVKEGNSDVVCFDRLDRVGGYCWIKAANKTSKLQTEFGAFHVWWGEDFACTGKCGGYPKDWECWPKQAGVLHHFQVAAEEYGILPHINFRRNVAQIDVVGNKDDHWRSYKLTVQNLDKEETYETDCSIIYTYPGSMTKNRIIEYPGEDIFGSHIGYGMGDDIGYDVLEGCNTAILGNGAFAVENARTCIEFGAAKVFLITRRRNLASPRVPCWFVHQAPVPVPARFILKWFEPMYKLAGWPDPWGYWSVHASSDRMKVSIIQNSRFGIGDVTFLACIYDKLEYIQDTLKRCTRNTLHLTSGRKLENIGNIVKALGLLGDYQVDRLHKMKEVVGKFCGGDWRRLISIDATGMNAANFSTFSLGNGCWGLVRMHKHLYDFPKEWYQMVDYGVMGQLPRHKAEEAVDKPAYVTEVRHELTTGIIMGSMSPKVQQLGATEGTYKHKMIHVAHPLKKYLEECKESWDDYQKTWKENGATHEYVPYPYTAEMVEGFFKDYSDSMGFYCHPYGPGDDLNIKVEPVGGVQTPEITEGHMAWGEQVINSEHKGWWLNKTSLNTQLQKNNYITNVIAAQNKPPEAVEA